MSRPRPDERPFKGKAFVLHVLTHKDYDTGKWKADRELIAFRGATQAEVARATGIGESVLSELVRGKRTMGRKTVVTLARYFKVDPGLFLASEGETLGTKE